MVDFDFDSLRGCGLVRGKENNWTLLERKDLEQGRPCDCPDCRAMACGYNAGGTFVLLCPDCIVECGLKW